MMRLSIKFFLLIIDEILIGGFLIFLLYSFGWDWWSYGLVIIILVTIIIFMAYIFLPQLRKPVTGTEGMIGRTGITADVLDPVGTISMKGELWSAESIDGRIEKGEKIIVEKVNGLELLVKKLKTNNKS